MKSLLKEIAKYLRNGETISFRTVNADGDIQVAISATVKTRHGRNMLFTKHVTVSRVELTMYKHPEHIDEWTFKELRREMNMAYDMADDDPRLDARSKDWSQDNTKGVPHV